MWPRLLLACLALSAAPCAAASPADGVQADWFQDSAAPPQDLRLASLSTDTDRPDRTDAWMTPFDPDRPFGPAGPDLYATADADLYRPPSNPLQLDPPPLLDNPQAEREIAATRVRLRPWQQVMGDYREFYSLRRVPEAALVIGGAGILANTAADEHFGAWWQEDVRNSGWDSLSNRVTWMGESTLMIPASLVLWTVAEHCPMATADAADRPWRAWSRQTARAYLLGAPASLILQRVTGGSRPGETTHGSDWVFGADANGSSGHAFVGAIPFLTAAELSDDWRWKGACYAGASMPGLARLNEDKHYLSQVLLGWWLASMTVRAVSASEQAAFEPTVSLGPVSDGMGLNFMWRK
jgi:hypothetical protein